MKTRMKHCCNEKEGEELRKTLNKLGERISED